MLNKDRFPGDGRSFGSEPEGSGKQIGKGGGYGRAGSGGVKDRGIGRSELKDGLATGSAGHACGAVEVDYSDSSDADGGTIEGDGGRDGGLFCAGGEAVGGIFDIGAGDDDAILTGVGVEQDGRADAEVAVGRVRVLGRLVGVLVERGDLIGRKVEGHGKMSLLGGAGTSKHPEPTP